MAKVGWLHVWCGTDHQLVRMAKVPKDRDLRLHMDVSAGRVVGTVQGLQLGRPQQVPADQEQLHARHLLGLHEDQSWQSWGLAMTGLREGVT